VQLDSLADLISFGMAPAVLAFQWGLLPLGRMGWAVGFVYLTAAALRLARFNIQAVTDKRYFVGLPSPAAAGLVAATVFYFPSGLPTYPLALLGAVMLVAPALLMVSTIRFRSFKTIDLQARRSYPVLLLVALGITLVAAQPQYLLVVMAYTYLVSGFVGLAWTRFRRRTGHEEPAVTGPGEAEEAAPADPKSLRRER
jgi:CDP-diacylglycerol--serine O-phosphatidyltransferase